MLSAFQQLFAAGIKGRVNGVQLPEPAAVLNNILSDGMRQVAQRVLDGNYRKPGRDRI